MYRPLAAMYAVEFFLQENLLQLNAYIQYVKNLHSLDPACGVCGTSTPPHAGLCMYVYVN